MITKELQNYMGSMRMKIEKHCKIWMAWTVPANEKKSQMHFTPMTVSDYLCDLAPGNEGAICQYVWTMAFAKSRKVYAIALLNLATLLKARDVDFGQDISKESTNEAK